MNNSLAEHFNAFSYTRLNQVELSLDDNNEYQKALNTLDKTKDNPVDVAQAAIDIAKIAAYKQGFIDGLTLMAGFGAQKLVLVSERGEIPLKMASIYQQAFRARLDGKA